MINFAVIPARGGSKRIPRKNIRNFAGRPMISYAISLARRVNLFEKIIVSTDDHEIARIARLEGAEVPFLRPQNLSDDFTPTVPVIAHAIRESAESDDINAVCCIYPATPFIDIEDIRNALELLERSSAHYCMAVAEYSSPIQRALLRDDSSRMMPLNEKFQLSRTQDLPRSYYDAGQFYWGWTRSWLNNTKIHENSVGFSIPAWRAVDIDTENDWRRAELLYQVI